MGDIIVIDLKTGYLLSAFADFESALAATEKFAEEGYKIAYLNEVSHVKDFEVECYLKSTGAGNRHKYQNYLYPKKQVSKAKPKESLETALELLKSRGNCETKYMVVLKDNH